MRAEDMKKMLIATRGKVFTLKTLDSLVAYSDLTVQNKARLISTQCFRKSLQTHADAESQIHVTAGWSACHPVSRAADPRGSLPKSSAADHAAGYLFKGSSRTGSLGLKSP